MAEPTNENKRPRIRKSAPTVRERAVAAQAEAEKPKSASRLRKSTSKLKRPVNKLRPLVSWNLPDNRAGRITRKILGWITPRYFINSWREVKQVTWPGRRETWRLTLAVFIFAVVFGALVYGVDKVLDDIFKNYILK